MTKGIFHLLAIALLMSCAKPDKQETTNYESKIDSILSLLTLEEKVGMIHASSSFTSGGVERLGIPELVMSDGPHGVRHEHGRDWASDDDADDDVSYLPTGIALASTWNRELGYKFGSVLGNEAKARGKDVILGPGINIIRSPLNGRNFEYLSEDPYLASEMAVGYIKGVQDQGIAACAKHYVANNQETLRREVDVKLDERALREIYLPGFKACVERADVYTIMGAYNKFRGQYCSHNEYLINEVLKGEFGFTGALISDWSAVRNSKEPLLYGTDIEMGTDLEMFPNLDYNKFFMADSALILVKNGTIPESLIDEKVRRILRVMYKANVFTGRTEGKRNTPENQQIALQVAEEGIVLLKNDNQLPLDKNKIKTLAIIGHNSIRKHGQEGGSSQVKALYEVTPLEGIKNLVGNDINIVFAEGYEPSEQNLTNEKLAAEAIKIAKQADAVIYIGGWIHNLDPIHWDKYSYDCESNDKKSLKLLFGQEELIKSITEVNKNTTVVIMGGSNVEMLNWIDKTPAVIQAWYPGMEGGNALANIIFGKTNPSGRLPMTFANSHLDYPSHAIGEFPGTDSIVNYTEGIFVGYRYFATKNIKPIFPFGHGLSYTTFEYKDLSLTKNEEKIKLSFKLSNTGEIDGKEVVQVYIHSVDSKIERSAIELKNFEKIALSTGETKQVTLELSNDSFKYYNTEKKEWMLESGTYEIRIGSSSEDIRLSEQVTL